jgi:hypothetical protein
MPYNPSNDQLKTLGFPSGIYYDGSTIYPGIGDGSECGGESPGSAQIMSTSNFQGPGAYFCCGSKMFFDNKTPKFFLAHPDLKWVPTTAANAANVPGVINIPSSRLLQIGRFSYTFNNGTYSLISKIHGGHFWYRNPMTTGEKTLLTSIDVLACQPSAELTSVPKTSTCDAEKLDNQLNEWKRKKMNLGN